NENKNPRGAHDRCELLPLLFNHSGANKTGFSGVWKMNREKSKFPAMFPAMENIRDVVSKIEHKEPNFSESMTITGVDGDRTVAVTYDTVLNLCRRHSSEGAPLNSHEESALSICRPVSGVAFGRASA